MVQTDKIENKEFLEKSITHLEKHGFENIKADIDDYETPKSYIRKETGNKITPDIVAMKNGRKYFFDISLKSERPHLLKSKWLFLDALSRMNANRFRIITTRGHYSFTEAMLSDINLANKTPIKIQRTIKCRPFNTPKDRENGLWSFCAHGIYEIPSFKYLFGKYPYYEEEKGQMQLFVNAYYMNKILLIPIKQQQFQEFQ